MQLSATDLSKLQLENKIKPEYIVKNVSTEVPQIKTCRQYLCLTLLGLVAIATNLDSSEAVSLAFGAAVSTASWSSFFQVISKPAQYELSKTTVARVTNSSVDSGKHLVSLIPLLDSTKVHMSEVSGPTSKVIQDMGSVDDGALSDLRLMLEPGKELGTA